jgi:hypothetical protein
MDKHEFLWGDRLPRCVQDIELEAVQKGTAEAFLEASHNLEGIQAFLIYIDAGPSAVCATGSAVIRMATLARNEDLRTRVVALFAEGKKKLYDKSTSVGEGCG